MELATVANVIGAHYNGPVINFDEVSINSRELSPGQLFIAIKGEHFDGHDFVAQATAKGAIAAIISKPMNNLTIPCLLVQNTRSAMATIATHHRQQMSATVMGVTGSCGKTTVKTLLTSILSQQDNTLSSQRSFNNDIGVPLTLLKLRREHKYAVCEMGANHAGEIAALTKIVKPDVAAITIAAAAHLEGFGSVEGVALAKGEIFQELPNDGVAVINNDDHYAEFWKSLAVPHRIVTFGCDHPADIKAESITMNEHAQATFQLITPEDDALICLQLMGEHNVTNALAATAMAYAKSIPIDAIQRGLEACISPDKRLVIRRGYAGATVIDDTYNANPLSANAAVSVLAQHRGQSIFVLGDMLELGNRSEEFHRQLGEHAKALGIQRLYCYGSHSQSAAQAFGNHAHHFTDQKELLTALYNVLHEEATVLVKGSNSMGMDKVVNALMEQ